MVTRCPACLREVAAASPPGRVSCLVFRVGGGQTNTATNDRNVKFPPVAFDGSHDDRGRDILSWIKEKDREYQDRMKLADLPL